MRKIELLLNEYGESHRNSLNKIIHWICVPLIFFSIVCLIWSIPADILKVPFHGTVTEFVNRASLLLLLTLFYYLLLSPPLFFGMLFFSLLCLAAARWMDQELSPPLWLMDFVIFVVAWIAQFYGHKVEGKKLSFLKDLQFLLVGPAWLMHFIYKKTGLKY